MTRWLGLAGLLCSAVASAAPASSSAADAACRQELVERKEVPDENDLCGHLVGMLYAELASLAQDTVTASAVQARPRLRGTQGSVGQTSAVPAAAPTPLAEAVLSLAGAETGNTVLTQISLNPLALLGADSAEQTSWASRTFDVAVLLPVGGESRLDEVEYVGVRLRYNAFGYASGRAALRALRERYKALAESSITLTEAMERAIAEASDPKACIEAISRREVASVESGCGLTGDFDALVISEREYRLAVEQARREADRRYFGLDLRADWGDPRLTGVAASRGERLLAALAAGETFYAGQRYTQLRSRLGVAYTHLDSGETAYSLDGGLGIEFGVGVEDLLVKGSVGLEGRGLGESLPNGDTRFLDLFLGVSVPVTQGAALNVGLALPLLHPEDSPREPMLRINGDWELLLSGR